MLSDAAMTYFYGHLFATEPEIRAMFPAAMDVQRERFRRALTRIARGEDDKGQLTAYLSALGRAHRKFGVRKEHYDAFRQALLATIRRNGPPGPAAQDAWEEAFCRAAAIMIGAAEGEALTVPAWWTAEVIAHEARAQDLAVLTVRPSEPAQPLRYLPGQHISVQTPRWPRLWRNYSAANAPREDGTLTLHVRAAWGGLVSTALVHHVRAGDTLLLAAPAGAMTADPDSQRDVLCLAGGTGLAPLRAIAEAISRASAPGRRREIVLYHGARRQAGLYDMPALQRMELDYPWLQVVPATSEEAVPGILHGTIPVLARDASWAGRDVYISGPDTMIAATVRVLRGLGAPPGLLHYDVTDELARVLARAGL